MGAGTCPGTPNKKGKYIPLHKLVTTPSKNSTSVLPFQLLSPTYDNKEDADRENEYMQRQLRRIRYTGSISPLSETCPPLKTDACACACTCTCTSTCTAAAAAAATAVEINELNKQLYEELRQGNRKPCHKVSKPTRPILKVNTDALNYLVTSSHGSVADATIYATEINAARQPVPMVTSPWEKLTIPVNPAIKSRYVRLRRELFADEITTDEDRRSDVDADAAIVRGFAFAARESAARSPFYVAKKLRWAE